MAVNELKNPSSLKLKLDCGLDDATGKTKVKSKTFSNVRANAEAQKIHEVAVAIASLQEHDLLEVIKLDNTTLSE